MYCENLSHIPHFKLLHCVALSSRVALHCDFNKNFTWVFELSCSLATSDPIFYGHGLIALGLTKLVERRFRGDMIETYKIVSGKENIHREKFFQMAPERGNPELFRGEKLAKNRPNKSLRANTFSQRVVNPWNNLKKK